MTKRIQNAIDIFLDAINEGTLAKGTCTACAVGNLVAHGMGSKVVKENFFTAFRHYTTKPDVPNYDWAYLFSTDSYGQQRVRPGLHKALAEDPRYKKLRDAIEKIDFTIDELRQIEYVFETNTELTYDVYKHRTKEEVRADQIKGLEAVVKLMLTFDEQVDDVKEVFTTKAEAIPC
jgi:hypothetical protein